MELSRKKVSTNPGTNVVGGVAWENEFKHKINDLLRTVAEIKDLEGLMLGLDYSYIDTNRTSVGPGVCVDDGGTDLITLSSLTELNISNNGLNGLDTGSKSANNWYYAFVIKNPTTGQVGTLASLSDTSPIMPSGFTKKRMVGAFRVDASNNTLEFFQVEGGSDRTFMYYQRHNILSQASPDASTLNDLDASEYVPTSAKARWGCFILTGRSGASATGTASVDVQLLPKVSAGSTFTTSSVTVRIINTRELGDAAKVLWMPVNSSGLVVYRRTSTNGDVRIHVDVLGYRLEL